MLLDLEVLMVNYRLASFIASLFENLILIDDHVCSDLCLFLRSKNDAVISINAFR